MFELVLNGLNWFKPVATGYTRFSAMFELV